MCGLGGCAGRCGGGPPKLVWMGGCGRTVVHWLLPAVLSWVRIYCWHCCVELLQLVQGIEGYVVYDGFFSGVCLSGWMLWCPVVMSGWTRLTFESYWSYHMGG